MPAHLTTTPAGWVTVGGRKSLKRGIAETVVQSVFCSRQAPRRATRVGDAKAMVVRTQAPDQTLQGEREPAIAASAESPNLSSRNRLLRLWRCSESDTSPSSPSAVSFSDPLLRGAPNVCASGVERSPPRSVQADTTSEHMPSPVTGLHHVTAISGSAQQIADVYAGLLGLRLVKRTVNFDDPGTYHLYFADGEARPGSFLTFFPWGDAALRGRVGAPQATSTAYAAPLGAVDLWLDRLASHAPLANVTFDAPTQRFGAATLALRDPDGLVIEIIETPDASGGWSDGHIPPEAALGAFHSVTLQTARPDATLRVLIDAFGYEEHGEEDGRLRLVHPRADRARFIDVMREPGEAGRMGAGTVHHIAFRVPDDAAELEARDLLLQMGLQPTPQIDRQYFHSVYCREPGGILFEIATDPPGFDTDEPADALGQKLMLPPQYESQRAAIEARLPPLHLPT